MAAAQIPSRYEEIRNGGFRFTDTEVEYFHNGIKGLKHFVPIAQGDWHLFNAATHHELKMVYETVTSRICARQEAVETGAKVSSLRKRILLPNDFGSWSASPEGIIVTTRKNANVVNYRLYLYKAGSADAAINGISIEPSVVDTFEQFAQTPSGTYAPGDLVTLEVKFDSDTIGHWCEIADIKLLYVSARGNI